MATQTSPQNSQIHHKDAILPSLYTSILYSLNNFSYHLQKFSFTGFIQQLTDKNCLNEGQSGYFLMGKRIDNFKQCLQVQKDLIFFSYRKNFKLTETMTSDFGWGCLLRVGQMAIAQALRLHFNYKNISVPKTQIIQSFLQADHTTTSYSIQKLTKQAKIQWNKDLGEWYSQIEMLSVFQQIHEKNPIKGAQDLCIKLYNESIDLIQLKKELYDSNICKAQQSFENGLVQDEEKDTLQATKQEEIDLTRAIYKTIFVQKQQKTAMVVINTSLGAKHDNQMEFGKLLSLMELPIFMGCIAGVKGKAKFLTGKLNKNVSFLDPHLVQQAEFNLSNELNTESYVCEDYLLMSRDKLSPQISICFFIKNINDLQMLKAEIDKLKQSQSSQQNDKFINYRQKSNNTDKTDLINRFTKANSQQIQILDQYSEDYLESQSFTVVL